MSTPEETRGYKNRSLETPCIWYETTKWDNLFAVGCNPCRWRRGSWWLRSSVDGYNIHLDGSSSMTRFDQSASHAELIIDTSRDVVFSLFRDSYSKSVKLGGFKSAENDYEDLTPLIFFENV